MKTMKKYLAFMISLFMIAALWPATVYASVEEGDAAEEIWDAVEEAPMPELTEESVAEPIEEVSDEETLEVEVIIPDEPSELITDEPSAAEVEEIEEEVPENVGAGMQVGDGVTATFDPVTGEVKFTSNGGTLWKDWLSKSGFSYNKIESIESTGKLYLPSDSGFLFKDLVNLKTLDASNFSTVNVTDMQYMFYDCRKLTGLDLSSFDTSNVTTMFAMFTGCSSLTCLDLGNFDTSNVIDVSYMFYGCSSLSTLILKNFTMRNVTSDNAKDVFTNCSALKLLQTPKQNTLPIALPVTLYNKSGTAYTTLPKAAMQGAVLAQNKQLSKGKMVVGDCVTAAFDSSIDDALNFYSDQGTLWNKWKDIIGNQYYKSISVSYGTVYLPSDSSHIFDVGYSLTNLDLSSFDTSKVTNMSHMFGYCSLTNLDLSSFDTSKVTNMSHMFGSCDSLTNLDLSSFNTSKVMDMSRMFVDCSSLTNLDLSSFDTSKVTDMSYMFYGCSSLTNLNLSGFNTTNVTDMSDMFLYCPSLTNLDLSSFNTSNVQNMSEMFRQCNSLTSLDLSNFNTTNVTDMSRMFEGFCDLTNLDLSSFNTTNVTDMSGMFSDCFSLTNLDLSGFNTTNVTNMSGMFGGSSSLTNLDLSSIDTTNVTNIAFMFKGCINLTNLDLSGFNTTNVTKMRYMFYECESLTNLDLSSFDTTKVSDFDKMFDGCTNLEILCTPKKHSTSGVALSLTMYDSAGKQYTELPVLSKSIVLGKTQKIAHEYAAKPISECTVTLKTTSYTYDGKTKKPAVTVKDGTKTLTSGTDYTVVYSKNKNAGKAVVTITATETGDYKGTKTVNFTIKKAAAGLAFAETSITKRSTDAPFTNPLTKATTAVATFTSDNESVATVDSATGKVTLKAAGTAIIIALANANANYNAGSTAYILTVEKPMNGFSDVQDPSHPFYNAIYWAAGAGITKGYADGTFGINRDCTRGEMIMFLWRFAGKPLPKAVWTSPFKDVPMSHSFFKAILWAYQTGITKGYSDGTFGINRNVSRGECMMFLWRIKGKPAPKSASKSPFKDVPMTHAFYKAILWGSQKGVTKGYTSGPKKGNFGINDNCTRGQIVTFLYRAKDL